MNPKVINVTLRAAVVVLSLIIIWFFFAPKSYGQFKPTPCICTVDPVTKDTVKKRNPKYYKQRFESGKTKYQEIKPDSSNKIRLSGRMLTSVDYNYSIQFANTSTTELYRIEAPDESGLSRTIRFNEKAKDPIVLKLGADEYLVWRGKVYLLVRGK